MGGRKGRGRPRAFVTPQPVRSVVRARNTSRTPPQFLQLLDDFIERDLRFIDAEGRFLFLRHLAAGFLIGGPQFRVPTPVVRLTVVIRLRGYDATSLIVPISECC
jgi:hypothetical protein